MLQLPGEPPESGALQISTRFNPEPPVSEVFQETFGVPSVLFATEPYTAPSTVKEEIEGAIRSTINLTAVEEKPVFGVGALSLAAAQ
jgi:hypothetical protein